MASQGSFFCGACSCDLSDLYGLYCLPACVAWTASLCDLYGLLACLMTGETCTAGLVLQEGLPLGVLAHSLEDWSTGPGRGAGRGA